MLIGIIIGVFIMSACTVCALIALDEDKENLVIFFGGPVVWIWVIVGRSIYAIYKRLRLYHFRNHYSALLFMCNGQSWVTYYVRNELVNAFYTDNENPEYYIKEVRSCKSAKSLPFKQNMINKNGVIADSGNSKFLCNYVRPSCDLYNKFNKTS